MSTSYIYNVDVSEQDFRAAVIAIGAELPDDENNTENECLIECEGSYAWASFVDGKLGNITQYGSQKSEEFIYEIAEHLGASCFDEHEDEFHEILDREGDEAHGLVTIDLSEFLEDREPDAVLDLGDDTIVPLYRE